MLRSLASRAGLDAFGQINNRSLFGLAWLDDKDLDAPIQSGIALFLRACAA